MNRTSISRTIWTLFAVFMLVLSGTLATTGSPPRMDSPTPTPTNQPAKSSHPVPPAALSTTLPPKSEPQGPTIYLTNYTFDPLSEGTPRSLPADLTLRDYSPGKGGYYLLQFHGPIQQHWKDKVVAADAQIFDYIPNFAFIVKMNDTTKAAVESMDIVRWVGLYQPGYRIASSLISASASVESAELVDVTVVVFKGEDVTALAERLQEMGATILDVAETHWKGKISAQLARSQINAVAFLSGVKWIEPSPEWKPLNDKAADVMSVREVWDTHGLYGAGQIVAVCDTGLDQGSTDPGSLHDDFEDGSGNSRVVVIHNRVLDGGANDVNSGHGTHVAGSVLGNGDLSGSTPGNHNYPSTAYVGMAPEANLVFQAVEHNAYPGWGFVGIPANLNILFSQVLGDGARIHSNSWGSDDAGAYTSASEDVDEFVWDHPDFSILFAAGNAGIDGDEDGVVDLYSLNSPGTAKNCITVGATENNRPSISDKWGDYWPDDYPADPINSDLLADDPDGIAAFSSRGPVLDGRIKPDLVAPGTFVASTRSQDPSFTGSGWGNINSYYMYMGGTSMATPLVAGAVALVREYYTTTQGVVPSAALIKATLINGATDIYPGQYGAGATQEITPTRPNNVEGWGLVNVENALFPTSPRTWTYEDETSGLSTGQVATYTFQLTDSSEPLQVTLAWSDYPGSPAASGRLVNDLDLSVTNPNGATYYPSNAAGQYLNYDDGVPTSDYDWITGRRVAVRFTPSVYPATLDKAHFMVKSRSSSYPKTFNYYVYDGDSFSGPNNVLAAGSTTIHQAGWHEVNLSGYGITVNSGDFFLAIELPDNDLAWFFDGTAPVDERSWDYGGSHWTKWTGDDYMFRAWVRGPTSFDRVNNVVGIYVDNPVTGTYTVTVQAYNVPYGPQPYALVASAAISTTLPPVVTSITPPGGVNTGTIQITNLAGDYFQTGASVKLTKSNHPDVHATEVTVVSSMQITCVLDLTGTATGPWSVVVTNPDSQRGKLVDGFTVNGSPMAPTVTVIMPPSGVNTGTVQISSLTGGNFQSAATVELTKLGQPPITAISVTVVSSDTITCSFDLAGVATGLWNVVVTNPDFQSGTLTNGFMVNAPLPVVYSITPDEATNTGIVQITNLAGSNFYTETTVKLTKTGELDINATSVTVVSDTQITCDFDLTAATPGLWDVVVTNPVSQSGQLTNGFTIRRAVYLPLTLKNHFINPYEDYDSWETAYGPLTFDAEYWAYPDDRNDYYYFELSTNRNVTVRVQNYQAIGDLLLYRDPPGTKPDGQWGRGGSTMTIGPVVLTPGRYYVLVYTDTDRNTNTLYILTVTAD